MKKRRIVLLTLLALLLVIGIPTGLLAREYRQERLSQDLIEAIKTDNRGKTLAALRSGADPNARDHSDDKPLTWREHVTLLLDKVLHSHVKTDPDKHRTALFWYLWQW